MKLQTVDSKDSTNDIPCPSFPVASPVDNFAEIVPSTRPQIMPPQLINKKVFYLGLKETLSLVNFGKIGGVHWNRVFPAWSYVY